MSNEALTAAIENAGITVTVRWDNKYVPSGDDGWDVGAHHYKVTFKREVVFLDVPGQIETRKVTVPFHTGSGHTTEPTAADVMECLLLDTSGVINCTSFEDWANEYGFDTDSRKAERDYKAVVRQGERLRSLLGEDTLSAWLIDDEIMDF